MRVAAAIGDVIVAGGGPAGAALACRLARAGRRVTVIERDAAPAHKVCGEFISGRALARLATLGIDVASLGAKPIRRLRLLRGTHMAETELPFPAAGLSRRTLDAALLAAAEASGAVILRGHAIRRVSGATLEVDQLGAISAPHLFLATGKHELRGAQRSLARPARETVGFKLHLRLAPEQSHELDGTIELLLIHDTYVGLQLVEGGMTNLCLVTPGSRLRATVGWGGLLSGLCRDSPHLARRLAGAQGWPRPLAITRVPYGFLHRPGKDDDTAFRLGDQMGVIPSFTGDGIAIALHTAELAAAGFLAGCTPGNYHAQARAEIARPIRFASALDRAGRWGPAQGAIVLAARLWPGVLGSLARITRG